MIVVTGAAGFISSAVVALLNEHNYTDLVLVDRFDREDRKANYESKQINQLVHRDDFSNWLNDNGEQVQCVIHLGARTDTTEFDKSIFDTLNVDYSKMVWAACTRFQIPLIYASSAATYGMGELGYEDSHDVVGDLKPLNPYGDSKNDFDKWVLEQKEGPYFWAGLKFFNVYGPNEYHKGRMASVVWHAFNQISKTGAMKLFRSHNEAYKNGEQKRDFVYVKDVAEVIRFLMEERPKSGIYNLGSGEARTFLDLVKSTFAAMNTKEEIGFIDTPEDIRDTYQYFTEANMDKLISVGYSRPFTSLEEGVNDYVSNYLLKGKAIY
ncbi:MAG: ADP-L-glycero-D-manno-heptose 6-epimerase [Sphingobacteriales bacterium]|jgi:ADP-L-glycero-D-manno-heptose 6-epimerase